MLAELTRKAMSQGGRVLQLVPKLEHVTQNYQELWNHVDDKHEIGICCSKLNKFQIQKKVVVATASSFLRRRTKAGAFQVCLIDEVHNVPNDPESGYRKIVRSLQRLNPKMLIAGVSGTPFREAQGMMHQDCVKGKALFTKQVYETPISLMIEQGFLSHIVSINGNHEIDLNGVKMSGNDYNIEQMGKKFDMIVEDAVEELRRTMEEYNLETAIVFVANVANAKRVKELWGNDNMRVLHGGIHDTERKQIIRWLEEGKGTRIVVNPNILCEGYDFPALDLVCLMRATASLRLYVQMVTRAIRAHSEKVRGYILDFGSNIDRHGPIDKSIEPKNKKKRGEAPRKQCLAIMDETIVYEGLTYTKGTECAHPNLLSAKKCVVCGALFISDNDEGKYFMRTRAQVLALKKEKEEQKQFYEVSSVAYSKHVKEGKEMIKMTFYTKDYNDIEQYVCDEYLFSIHGRAVAIVKSMLKDGKDLKKIYQFQDQMCAKNVLFLFEQYYSQFFRKIAGITVINNKGFKNIVEFHF